MNLSRKKSVVLGAAAMLGAATALGVHFGCKDQGGAQARSGLISVIGDVTGQRDIAEGVNIAAEAMDAEILTPADEDGMGQTVALSLTNTHRLTADQSVDKYVSLVGLTLVDASPRPVGNWVFGVLETDEVNAYAGPNGYIFVTRGALKLMRDESELAGVLAHEITHVLHHHGLQGVKNSSRTEAMKKGIGLALRQKDRYGVFNTVADPVKDGVLNTGYNQPQEFDADKNAVSIMVAAGYDPEGLARFLSRLQGGGGFSTHPGSAERVRRVRAQIAQLGNPKGSTLRERFEQNTRGGRAATPARGEPSPRSGRPAPDRSRQAAPADDDAPAPKGEPVDDSGFVDPLDANQ